MEIKQEEWIKINNNLEKHHSVFYKLWQVGKPRFTKEIDTAAISFDKDGEYLEFIFNEEFWSNCSFNKKLFVICHEMLHIILNHGKRATNKSISKYAINSCLDVVVNHMLISKFGFVRSEIEDSDNYCWVDTIFKDKNPLPATNECFEYYLTLFKQQYGDGGIGEDFSFSPKTVDDHSELFKDYNQIDLDDEEKASLYDKIKKHIDKNQMPGFLSGNWMSVKPQKYRPKKKWETVIKKWTIGKFKNESIEKEQWARKNRRISTLENELMMPSEVEVEDLKLVKSKIKLWFFLDASGSCIDLKDRFFSAAISLPKDKFDINLFTFDTKVMDVNIEKRRIYGGGGTSFKILEEKIQNNIKFKKEKYPNAVFVITDGYGDTINPEKPQNWHWFLTKNGSKSYINKLCNIYYLSDYE